jgi:hypothetical protein
MDKMEYIYRLLNIDKKLICINNLLEELGCDIEQINEIATKEILDELGVPKNSETFCRDWYYDLFGRFYSSEITNEEFIRIAQETDLQMP